MDSNHSALADCVVLQVYPLVEQLAYLLLQFAGVSARAHTMHHPCVRFILVKFTFIYDMSTQNDDRATDLRTLL